MNFVGYCHIFLCICIIYDVISMYLDVFGDFPRSPPYFGYNSAGQENHVLCILLFQGPIRSQIDRGFLRIIIFQILTKLSFETTQMEPGGGKYHGWRAHPP